MIRIPLTQGRVALIDDCDAHLARFRWHVLASHRAIYAVRNVRKASRQPQRKVYLHREVLGVGPGFCVDHRNGDGLDCRRANLRVATVTENNRNAKLRSDNKSGFRGVHFRNDIRLERPWTAQIRVHRIRRHLGCFASAEEAARAYDAAAMEYFGEYAVLNFANAAPTVQEDRP